MRIIIKWLPQAITLLDNIYRFYSEKSRTAAIRLYNKLLDSAEPLRVFPQAGPIEPLLKEYDCEFRSLVVEKTLQADLHGYRRTNRNPCRLGLPPGRMAPARNVQIIFVKRQQNASQFIFT